MNPFSGQLIVRGGRETVESGVVRILEQIEDLVPCEEDRREIAIVLMELIANAVIWGNRENPQGSVRVDFTIEEGFFECTVEDQGLGFNRSQVLSVDRLGPPASGGRGLQMVDELCDSVSRNTQGNRVTIRKQI